MLGRFGETLVVNWGLAKSVVDARAGGDDGDRSRPAIARRFAVPDPPRLGAGDAAVHEPRAGRGELDRVGPASDVYGLGATLYCLLVGHGPFADGDVADVLQRVRRGDLPLAPTAAAVDRPGIEAACLRAMSVNPRGPAPHADRAGRGDRGLAGGRPLPRRARAGAGRRQAVAGPPGHRARRPPVRARDDRRGDALAGPRPGERPARLAGARPRPSAPAWGAGTPGPRTVERTLTHRDAVHAVAFSPDGRRLATACPTGRRSSGTSPRAPSSPPRSATRATSAPSPSAPTAAWPRRRAATGRSGSGTP